jgi:hypothetical protein
MNFDPQLTNNKILSRVVIIDKETRASVDIY